MEFIYSIIEKKKEILQAFQPGTEANNHHKNVTCSSFLNLSMLMVSFTVLIGKAHLSTTGNRFVFLLPSFNTVASPNMLASTAEMSDLLL